MCALTLPIISHAQIWVARYNGPGNGEDGAHAIAVDNAGNVYVTGPSPGYDTYIDYATVKYNSSGVEQWVARYDGPAIYDDYATVIAVDAAGNAYVTGPSEGCGTWQDYATVKYSSMGIEEAQAIQIESSYFRPSIVSGPLQLPWGKNPQIYDTLGRIVKPGNIKPGIYFIEIEGVVV